MKIIKILILIGILQSCGIQYEGDTKFEVIGRVLDKDNNPIINEYISLNIGESAWGGFILPSVVADYDFSYIRTNSQGYFQLLVPNPAGDDNFELKLGEKNNPFKRIIFSKNNIINYKIDLGNITKFNDEDLIDFTIKLNKISNNNLLENIIVEGLIFENRVFLNPIATEPYYNEQNINYNVLKNQILIIKYKLKDISNNNAIQQFSQSISITNVNKEIIINF